MNIFTYVKAAVTTRQAAIFYGLKVSTNGMTCCPFHPDKHPSMKVDERYFCFGCHETGDVIDFVSKLFGLTPYQATRKLVEDFDLHPSPSNAAAMADEPLYSQNLDKVSSFWIDYPADDANMAA